jgi:dihydrodipicolinate synthase/N-acetylneuraminate lyase
VTYSICEVFHNEKGIMGHGDACLEGDNIKELRYNYKMIAEAFDHPIIVYDEKKETYFENGKEIKIVRLEAKNVTKFKFGESEIPQCSTCKHNKKKTCHPYGSNHEHCWEPEVKK